MRSAQSMLRASMPNLVAAFWDMPDRPKPKNPCMYQPSNDLSVQSQPDMKP